MDSSRPPQFIEIEAPQVIVAPLGEINVYPITEEELNRVDEGSPASLHLNFALWFLSSGLTLATTLWFTNIESRRVFDVFVITFVVFLVAGVVLMGLWLRGRKSQNLLIRRIRSRMPPKPRERDGVAIVIDTSRGGNGS